MENKNVLPEVLKRFLDIEINEKFKIATAFDSDLFFVTVKGDVMWVCGGVTEVSQEYSLGGLLIKKSEIVKLPWRPKTLEDYWYIHSSGEIRKTYVSQSLHILDTFLTRTNNCYQTMGEITEADIAYHTAGLNSNELMTYGGTE